MKKLLFMFVCILSVHATLLAQVEKQIAPNALSADEKKSWKTLRTAGNLAVSAVLPLTRLVSRIGLRVERTPSPYCSTLDFLQILRRKIIYCKCGLRQSTAYNSPKVTSTNFVKMQTDGKFLQNTAIDCTNHYI